MEEHYTGRSVDISEAVGMAQNIVVAVVKDVGAASPGAPGQAYYDNAKIGVVESLRGTLEGEVTISYTLQTLPEEISEAAPSVGGEYLFFIQTRPDESLRAIKILQATEDNLDCVKAALGGEQE